MTRLPSQPGERINRSRVLSFTFDGRTVEALEGDTIASALYAGGQRTFSRSFKYHRRRGLLCCAGQCPNCLVAVDGASREDSRALLETSAASTVLSVWPISAPTAEELAAGREKAQEVLWYAPDSGGMFTTSRWYGGSTAALRPMSSGVRPASAVSP